MIFKFAFATRVREIVRVLRGLPPDDAVRQRTLAINEQLARLRATRLAQQKQREEAALREVQFVVEEMERLKESLTAAVSTLPHALYLRGVLCLCSNLLQLIWSNFNSRVWKLLMYFDSAVVQEEAAVEFVEQIGDQARAQLEDEWEKKAETLMAEMKATGESADASLPQETSQEPLVVVKSRTTVVETRVTPPES